MKTIDKPMQISPMVYFTQTLEGGSASHHEAKFEASNLKVFSTLKQAEKSFIENIRDIIVEREYEVDNYEDFLDSVGGYDLCVAPRYEMRIYQYDLNDNITRLDVDQNKLFDLALQQAKMLMQENVED